MTFGEESYALDRGESGADAPEYWYLVPTDPAPAPCVPLDSLPGRPRILPQPLVAEEPADG